MAFGTLATRKNAKLRLLLTGTSGSGKTYNALLIAGVLGGRIGLSDSERGSASKYANMPGMPPFYAENMEEKTPQEFLQFIQNAADAKIDVFIGDSYSHAWMAALEIVDKMGGNKFANGWKVVTPLLQRLTDALLSYPGHVICTAREKAEYAVEKDDKTGKAAPRKLGMAPVLRDGTDYEFDVVLSLSPNGVVNVTKTRCSDLRDGVYTWKDIPKIAAILKAWLSDGAPLSPLDALFEKLKFAGTEVALKSLGPDVKAHLEQHPADKAKLEEAYRARKAALLEAAP